MTYLICCLLLFFSIITDSFAIPSEHCESGEVSVLGFAQSFIGDRAIKKALIKRLDNKQQYQTDQQGKFHFCVKPGTKLTLSIHKSSFLPWKNYKDTQTGTYIVSKHGLVGPFNNVTFQVPLMSTYHLLKAIIVEERGISLDPSKCNVVTTVTAYHKTLNDDPQGEPGAVIVLRHLGKLVHLKNKPFYFGIMKGKTNPFTPNLKQTSLDGGVLIYNLRPSKIPYEITAKKSGVRFNRRFFLCQAGEFINLSPPNGPMVQK